MHRHHHCWWYFIFQFPQIRFFVPLLVSNHTLFLITTLCYSNRNTVAMYYIQLFTFASHSQAHTHTHSWLWIRLLSENDWKSIHIHFRWIVQYIADTTTSTQCFWLNRILGYKSCRHMEAILWQQFIQFYTCTIHTYNIVCHTYDTEV